MDVFRLPEHSRCIVGSMACELRGDRLRIVWFRWTRNLGDSVDDGQAFTGKAQQTFVEAKRRIAAKVRRRYHRRRAA